MMIKLIHQLDSIRFPPHNNSTHTLHPTLRELMLKKKTPPSLNHLLTINCLTQNSIQLLIDRAKELSTIKTPHIASHPNLPIITNLFFEPSTRTQYSFEIAAQRLLVPSITPNIPSLSTLKGESLLDTIHNLEMMGSSLFIIRHSTNHTPEFIASELLTDAKVLNAGDGTHQHPSQCLIDLMTIQSQFTQFEQLSVAILGDTHRSRVARSLTAGLQLMGTRDIRFITPPPLQTDLIEPPEGITSMDIKQGLQGVDVIICLRVQQERIDSSSTPIDQATYFKHYGLTAEKLTWAKPHAIVMHPGPINRGFEIESSVADGDQSLILQQAKNSVPMRMAILEALLN